MKRQLPPQNEEERGLYDGWLQGFLDQGYDQAEAATLAEDRLDTWRAQKEGGDEDKAYKWLNQLPAGFTPGVRIAREYGYGTYSGPGLVDSNGRIVRNADGSIKNTYGPDDVQGILRGLPYTVRRQLATTMQNLKLYGGSSPSANVDQLQDFNAFARLLYTGNQEGLAWDAALDLIAKRSRDIPRAVKTYKSSNIADIKKAIQQQAQDILGRELQSPEITPLAKRVAQREIAVQKQADVAGATQRAPQPSTIVENQVQKQFQPEADAYKFAQFVDVILGTK